VRLTLVLLLLSLLLGACSHSVGNRSSTPISVGLINNFPMIERDFERGLIMKARQRVLALKSDDSDYRRAHAFLKKKIEPARRRIFTHYLRTARKLEHNKLWSEALWAYDQAKAVTIKPEVMEAKRAEMEMNMRRVRFQSLLEQRRLEDKGLLDSAIAYESPKGVAADDEIYLRKREQYLDQIDDRADLAYREARRFLRLKKPEVAWVEVESQLRLQPGSPRGLNLRAEIARDMPKGITIPSQHSGSVKFSKNIRKPIHENVSEKTVKQALKEGRLIEARQMALAYRRLGGKGAESLLAEVRSQLGRESAILFDKGSQAFRNEKLDDAIANWTEAVRLTPGKGEYLDALHRARQLQERLNLLRNQKESKTVFEAE